MHFLPLGKKQTEFCLVRGMGGVRVSVEGRTWGHREGLPGVALVEGEAALVLARLVALVLVPAHLWGRGVKSRAVGEGLLGGGTPTTHRVSRPRPALALGKALGCTPTDPSGVFQVVGLKRPIKQTIKYTTQDTFPWWANNTGKIGESQGGAHRHWKTQQKYKKRINNELKKNTKIASKFPQELPGMCAATGDDL